MIRGRFGCYQIVSVIFYRKATSSTSYLFGFPLPVSYRHVHVGPVDLWSPWAYWGLWSGHAPWGVCLFFALWFVHVWGAPALFVSSLVLLALTVLALALSVWVALVLSVPSWAVLALVAVVC